MIGVADTTYDDSRAIDSLFALGIKREHFEG